MTSLWDLDLKILERTDAHNLKAVSRVKREWRSYIVKNFQKMRSFLAQQVNVTYDSVLNVYWITARSQTANYIIETSVNKLIKYKTSLFSFTSYGSVWNSQIKNDIDALPSWWFKQITKVDIHLNDYYEAEFLSRFENLSNVTVTIYDIYLFALFIERAPRIDILAIVRFTDTLCDFALEVLLTKSSIYPLEFPVSSVKCHFSLSMIIHFIENNNFTNKDQHSICIMSKVIGKEKDFTEWIKTNCTSFTCLAQNHHYQAPNNIGFDVQGRKWNFTFRRKKFEVLIAGFVNT